MSRVGKAPVTVAKGIKVTITPANEVVVQGAKWTQSVQMRPEVNAKLEGEQIVLTRKDDSKTARELHGLFGWCWLSRSGPGQQAKSGIRIFPSAGP